MVYFIPLTVLHYYVILILYNSCMNYNLAIYRVSMKLFRITYVYILFYILSSNFRRSYTLYYIFSNCIVVIFNIMSL